MKKPLLFATALSVVLVSVSDARVYKGQKEFIKKCRSCHNNGQELAYSKVRREWSKLFKKRGKPLAELHLKAKKAKDSYEYFESSRFSKNSKHLKDFFEEYAKDSGNVPACD